MGNFIEIRAGAVVGKMSKSKDWVVWCKWREKEEKQRPFEVDGKEIFADCSK